MIESAREELDKCREILLRKMPVKLFEIMTITAQTMLGRYGMMALTHQQIKKGLKKVFVAEKLRLSILDDSDRAVRFYGELDNGRVGSGQ